MPSNHIDRWTRRTFLAPALIGLTAKGDVRIDGGFVDDSHESGHRLRDRRAFPAPKRNERMPVVIVGTGIAGLSAAWRLDKRGFRDFVLLEMQTQAGGNARWGEDEISGYPWAAHYIPVPGKGAPLVRELMEELGVLHQGEWSERHLCHSPQERLYLHGRWQEGLEPEVGATRADIEQFRRFHERMDQFGATGDFAIPTETGRMGQAELDRTSMADWMAAQRFDSPYLNWYVDYACRDDYGARASDTSAWAGVHYFASRPRAEEKGPLTWPEGNGWIVKRLLERLGRYIRTAEMVHQISAGGKRVAVITSSVAYSADYVIFAAPTYLASYLCQDQPTSTSFQYSPWLTANLFLDRWPGERGMAPAWDNVIYKSRALGYVVATHQSLRTQIDRTIWTYYWALSEFPPSAARRLLLEKDWRWWTERILADLSQAHPDIRQCVRRIDLMRLGHAMIRPVPGFIFSDQRRRWLRTKGRVLFANSDLSGLSLFEEAQYRGVTAADRVLRELGR
jgi:glycine/D-amino acid oxidase-like deaminating enzyme